MAKEKKTQKEALGFQNGSIIIFKGETYPVKDWFKENGAKYTKMWGWSFAAMPDVELPEGVTPVTLTWEAVGNEDGSLKLDNEVKAAVEELIYDESPSEFVGEIGDKIELDLYVQRTVHLDGYYGASTMHIMEDEDENVFIWTTTARNLNAGEWYRIKGKIKDHRTYKHVKQTILTRCKAEEL